MPRFDAASISITSSEVPAAISAGVALPARLRRRPLHAIQRFRQDSRRRRLSHAPRSRKNVRVRHAVILDRVSKRLGYVLLADEIVKRLLAPLAGYDLVAHGKVFQLSALSAQ